MYEKICMGARLSLSYGADAETTNNKLTVAIDFFYHVIKNAIWLKNWNYLNVRAKNWKIDTAWYTTLMLPSFKISLNVKLKSLVFNIKSI